MLHAHREVGLGSNFGETPTETSTCCSRSATAGSVHTGRPAGTCAWKGNTRRSSCGTWRICCSCSDAARTPSGELHAWQLKVGHGQRIAVYSPLGFAVQME